ncbi:MAG TPA: bifunctional DNA primase/polymerase [Pyrinomonadaceae bacterium]|jgi:putative DNA primase/helicase
MEFIQTEYLNSANINNEFNNELLDWALHYASVGYPIFPLHNIIREKFEKEVVLRCSCREWRVCRCQGKHPRTPNGFYDATIDENKIIDWWEKYPDANIGLLTGKESGIIVLDIDRNKDGEYSIRDLQDFYKNAFKSDLEFEPLPGTLISFTGAGGRHLYFKYPLEYPIKNSTSKIGNGLDIRANNGFVVAPPSSNISGKYVWHGVNTQIGDAPAWLLYEIMKDRDNESRQTLVESPDFSQNQLNQNQKIIIGQRNDFLSRYAWGLVRSFPEEEVLRRCLIKNDNAFEEPLRYNEVNKIVTYACKNYKKKSTNM